MVELFAGIGSQRQALKNAELPHKVVAISEIDKFALRSYEILHGPTLNLGDITKINVNDVPDCDLITYSFPCQDISAAGRQEGLDEGSATRSSLLWECEKIIKAKRPKYLLMENVKNLVGVRHKDNFDKWINKLENLGYKNYWKIINSVDYGCPTSRERVFMVSILHSDEPFDFPNKYIPYRTISDIMEKEVKDNYFYPNHDFVKIEKNQNKKTRIKLAGYLAHLKGYQLKRVYDISGVLPTITATNVKIKILLADGRIRRITPREDWRAMGWRDSQFNLLQGKISNAQLYKQIGNSIAVPVLEEIFKKIYEYETKMRINEFKKLKESEYAFFEKENNYEYSI